MSLEVQLLTSAGTLVASLSRRLTSGTLDTDAKGAAVLSLTVRMPSLAEQFRYYDREGALRAVVLDGAVTVWEGRVEEVGVGAGELTIVAYGAWRALSDAPYTALWSETRIDTWKQVTTQQESSRAPERFNFDAEGRIQIAPVKGANIDDSHVGSVTYETPVGGS